MSITSRFKKERLFKSISKFSKPVDNDYFESIYYLINSVEYNDKKKVTKVVITIIIDVKNYLELQHHRKIEETFEDTIPRNIIDNIKVWELLLD